MFLPSSVMTSLSDYLHLLTNHPKGSFEVQTLQTAKYQCLETFHMQVLSSACNGWHVWIWLELLVEPKILGRAREK